MRHRTFSDAAAFRKEYKRTWLFDLMPRVSIQRERDAQMAGLGCVEAFRAF